VHVCRGNWSTDENVLLEGDYTKLVPAFAKMKTRQFVLEYATPRAGDVEIVGPALADREIGLGVVNPRTTEAEPVEEIVARAERALQWFAPERMYLNPDCGFACFANRGVNEAHIATEKLRHIALAARELRERHG
jgi:5-methyltetrahydropteroyltriglutamate--homocysteine methyltransferase